MADWNFRFTTTAKDGTIAKALHRKVYNKNMKNKLHNWLIRLVVGERPVIINCVLERATVTQQAGGLLVSGCQFKPK